MKKPNYEKRQFEEQKETNMVLWINTAATVGAFIILLWDKIFK